MHNTQTDATSATSSKSVLTVPVDEVQPKPQIRKQFSNIDALAESLLVEGQQTPIIVYPQNKEGKYLIQKGERRWRACKHANISTIDIIVNNRKLTPLDETAGELIENIQREDLTAMEIAAALNEFIDQGWKQVDIARRLGKSPKFVSAHLGLLKLPECVITIYEEGTTADTDTLNILRQLHELAPEKCRALCQEAKRQGINRKRAREVLNETLPELGAANDTPKTPSPTPSDTPANRQASMPRPRTVLQPPQWQEAQPDQLCFIVKIIRGEHQHQSGLLLTDRVSANGRAVWLRTESGSSCILCVDISEVKLVRIEKSITDK